MGLTNDDVIWRWVKHNETDSYPRSHAGSGNLKYSGTILYSYRTPIARYHDGYVLITSVKWGVTTARHINDAEHAVNFVSFRVPYIDDDLRGTKEDNVHKLDLDLINAVKQAVRLFKYRTPEEGEIPWDLRDHIVEAHQLLCTYERRVLNRKKPVVAEPIEYILQQVRKDRNEKWAAFMEPKKVEQRERAQARRLAREALESKMSEDRIKTRWLAYVARGEGKSRSDSFEKFSYRGNVLYSQEWPVARLVMGPHRNWVCVTKTGVQPYNPKSWKDDGKPKLVVSISVPCVGVFSKFEGDQVDDGKLHERINWLSHCEAQHIIECAQLWPADKLLVKTGWRGIGKDTLMREMRHVYTQHEKYSNAFGLGWPSFPEHYNTNLLTAIEAREKAYFDPKAVEQRERQSARKQAKEALGLE